MQATSQIYLIKPAKEAEITDDIITQHAMSRQDTEVGQWV